MYAVAEPYQLQVFLESLEVLAVAVSFVVCVDVLEGFADLEVVTSVLVPDDVAPHLRGLRQIVEHLLLL